MGNIYLSQWLEKLKLPSMCYRRLRGDLIEVFKYTHNMNKLSDNLLELETKSNTRSYSYKLVKQRYNTTLRQHFFTQRIVDGWISLSLLHCWSGRSTKPERLQEQSRLILFMCNYIIYMYSLEKPSISIRPGKIIFRTLII